MQAERRLEELGLELPPPPKPGGNYLPALQVGTLLFLSGHGPGEGKGRLFRGRLMQDLTVEEGYASARQVALSLLRTLKETLGDLDRINRIVKLTGFVNSVPEFIDQPKVINGASDLLVDVFGEKGRHTRSAIGMVALPGGIPVEIEMIVELAE